VRLVDTGLWLGPPQLPWWPAQSRRFRPLYGDDRAQIASLLIPACVTSRPAPATQDPRRRTLLALIRLYRSRRTGPCLVTETYPASAVAGGDAEGRQQALLSLLRGTQVAVTVASARWAAPEFAASFQ
jgi:hypothetical protein